MGGETFERRIWIQDELVMETARRLERHGLGRVIDDGDGGPALWLPAGDPAATPAAAAALAYTDLCGDDGPEGGNDA